jgi:hypothetical protein
MSVSILFTFWTYCSVDFLKSYSLLNYTQQDAYHKENIFLSKAVIFAPGDLNTLRTGRQFIGFWLLNVEWPVANLLAFKTRSVSKHYT